MASTAKLLPFWAALVLAAAPGAWSWSKEGHVLTCRIAQALLEDGAAEVVRNLLPDGAGGDLSSLCVWPDQVRHWYRFRWTAPLHFIDTPDSACSFDYASKRRRRRLRLRRESVLTAAEFSATALIASAKFAGDCRDAQGVEDMCAAGAVRNFTAQLMHYRHGTSDRRHNLTEALLFLSHFMGDIHQPMHVGFSGDGGGNSIQVRWFRHKSNLHHVWDREIILTALTDYYEKDLGLLLEDLQNNFTKGIWSDDISAWRDCDDLLSCPIKYAAESVGLACKWGYNGVSQGETLAEEYFGSRMPVVMKRIAQGGVRLAVFLNQALGDQEPPHRLLPSPT